MTATGTLVKLVATATATALCAAVLAGAVLSAPARATPAPTAQGEEPEVRSVVAAATCKGPVKIRLTLVHDPDRTPAVQLVAEVSGALPGYRWDVQLGQYHGDDGEVLLARRTADADGTWTLRTRASEGAVEADVRAQQRGTDIACAVGLEGVVARDGSPADPRRAVASGPCSGPASVSVALTAVPDRRNDRLVVRLRDGVPHQHWRVRTRVDTATVGSITFGPEQVGPRGGWAVRQPALHGRQLAAVHATGPDGQACAVRLRATPRAG